MTLSERLGGLVDERAPFSGRIESVVAEGEGVTIRCDFERAEGVGCSLTQIDLVEEGGRPLDPGELRGWAEQVCERVTYLLEPLGLVEVDAQSGAAVVRSKPPHRRGGRIAYYEMIADRNRHASLRRYQYDVASKKRSAVAFPLTREQLGFLVDDLAETASRLPK